LLILLMVNALLACGGSEERKAKYMEEGKQLFKEGDYEKAKLAFKNVLQIDPKDVESRFEMAEALSKLGDIQGAVGQYLAVVGEAPQHVLSRIRMGQIYLLVKNVPEAEKMAKEAITLEPENIEAKVLMGGVLASQNNNDAAIAQAESVLKQQPDEVSATLLLASLKARMNKVDEAIALLQQSIEKNPDKVPPRLMLTNLYVQNKNPDKAEQTLRSIIDIEPKQINHAIQLASFLISINQNDKAEAVLRETMVRLPEEEKAKLALIEFLVAKKSPDAAIAEITPMIQQKPDDYELRFKLADLQLVQKQFDKVEQTLKEIVTLDKLGPKSLTARNKLARLYAGTKRIDDAKAMIKEVITENPRDSEALTMRGEFSLAEKKLPEAIGDFRAVLVDQPQNTQVLKLLSAAYLMNKDDVLARENMEKTLEIAPKDEAARLDLVNLMMQKNQVDQAVQQIDTLLKLNPTSKNGFEALFKIHLSQKQWGQAQQDAKKVSEAYPNEATGYYLSGLAYQAEGQLDKSVTSFEQALAKQPETIEPLTQLVKSYLAMKQPAAAEKKLNEIVKKQDKNFVAFNLLGGVYASNNKPAEALKAYQKAIALKPEWPNPYRNAALINYAQKNKEAAINTLKTGIENTKGAMELIGDLANLYQQEGEKDKVLALYEDSYQKNPNSMLAINNLASYLSDYAADAASLDRAEKLAEPLAKTNNADMLDTVAWIAYKKGQYDKALPLLTKVVEMNPNSAVSHYHLGMVYFKQGDKAHAKEVLEKAINLKQQFFGLTEAQETLKSLN
ncbi:MAG: tetratricopeptide repeat protein, partial [Methylococcales bacterium]